MSAFPLTRRAALAALGGSCSSKAWRRRAVPTAATRGLRIRAIKVDVSPIRASMGDPTAAWVEQALPGALAQSLAPYMAPGDRNGATLVARIDTLYLGSSGGGPGFFGQTQDTINGTLLLKGPRGGVVANVPLRAISSYFPMAVDQAAVRAGFAGPRDRACAGLCWLGAEGAGSLDDFASERAMRVGGSVEAVVDPSPSPSSDATVSPRCFGFGLGASPEGKGNNGRQRHDSPGRA